MEALQAARSSGLLAQNRPSSTPEPVRQALSSIVPPREIPAPRSGRPAASSRALAITGIPVMKAPFEPLVPGAFRVPNTNAYRAEEAGFV